MASLPFTPTFLCLKCVHTLKRQVIPRSVSLPGLQSRALRTRAHPSRSSSSSPSQPPSRRINPSPRIQEHEKAYSPNEPRPRHPQSPPTEHLVPSKPSAPPARKSQSKPIQQLPDGTNWYWETLAPSTSQKTQADRWFTSTARTQFLRSVAYFRQFPESDVPEVAFVGRSNVGKSSLLNALVDADIKDKLARTSKTPGCTTTMNLYGVGAHDGVRVKPGRSGGHDRIVGVGGLLIVDLPGYGEGSLSEWGVEIMKYLANRKQLRRVFVLVDASQSIKDKDRSLLATLRLSGIPHQVLLSKLDKVYIPKADLITRFDKKNSKTSLSAKGSLKDLHLNMDGIRKEVQPPVGGAALGELLAVSSEVLVDGKRLGIDAVRVAVLQAAGVKYESKKEGKRKNIVKNMRTNTA